MNLSTFLTGLNSLTYHSKILKFSAFISYSLYPLHLEMIKLSVYCDLPIIKKRCLKFGNKCCLLNVIWNHCLKGLPKDYLPCLTHCLQINKDLHIVKSYVNIWIFVQLEREPQWLVYWLVEQDPVLYMAHQWYPNFSLLYC